MKAVSDVVEDSSQPHSLKCLLDHLQRIVISLLFPVSEQKKERVRCWKFGCVAETSVFCIKVLNQLLVSQVHHFFPDRLISQRNRLLFEDIDDL